jgi:hypothetical protein
MKLTDPSVTVLRKNYMGKNRAFSPQLILGVSLTYQYV